MGTQGWWAPQMKLSKVGAAHDLLRGYPWVKVTELDHRFRQEDLNQLGSHWGQTVLFVCVDSMAARREIWAMAKDSWVVWNLLVDGRMGAEVATVFSCDSEDEASCKAYERTLGSEGVDHAPCTMQATIYCGNVISGLMLCEMAKWIRGHGTTPLGRRWDLLSGCVDRMDSQWDEVPVVPPTEVGSVTPALPVVNRGSEYPTEV